VNSPCREAADRGSYITDGTIFRGLMSTNKRRSVQRHPLVESGCSPQRLEAMAMKCSLIGWANLHGCRLGEKQKRRLLCRIVACRHLNVAQTACLNNIGLSPAQVEANKAHKATLPTMGPSRACPKRLPTGTFPRTTSLTYRALSQLCSSHALYEWSPVDYLRYKWELVRRAGACWLSSSSSVTVSLADSVSAVFSHTNR